MDFKLNVYVGDYVLQVEVGKSHSQMETNENKLDCFCWKKADSRAQGPWGTKYNVKSTTNINLKEVV